MSTSSIRHGGERGFPSITPHSKSQLAMSQPDPKVYLHHSHTGKATIWTYFEEDDEGYEHVVVTPDEIRLMPGEAFSWLRARSQEMEVSDEWRRRILDAYGHHVTSVRSVMQDLRDSDVGEVVGHG